MAMIFRGYRPRIARQMATGNEEIKRWLRQATFAKASTGHWMAWHDGDLSRVAVLPPDHPAGEECFWIESWDKDFTIAKAVEYVESGDFDADEPAVLNIFIKNPVTGQWE